MQQMRVTSFQIVHSRTANHRYRMIARTLIRFSCFEIDCGILAIIRFLQQVCCRLVAWNLTARDKDCLVIGVFGSTLNDYILDQSYLDFFEYMDYHSSKAVPVVGGRVCGVQVLKYTCQVPVDDAPEIFVVPGMAPAPGFADHVLALTVVCSSRGHLQTASRVDIDNEGQEHLIHATEAVASA